MVEEQAAKDAGYRRDLKRTGKSTLSDARALTDSDLVGKLTEFNVHLDRDSFRRLCSQALSSEEIATSLMESEEFREAEKAIDDDWLWLSLTVLWERWFPDLPSFERLDDRMHEGYRFYSRDAVAACQHWLDAWNDVLVLADKAQPDTLAEFDERFGGTQLIFNWIQDFESVLHNAGLKQPEYHRRRLDVCEEFLRRFSVDSQIVENMRRSIAEIWFDIGEPVKGDELFRLSLDVDPQWGWGWIAWSDQYALFARPQHKDLAKAEALLKCGLAVENVRDREDIVERLALIKEESGGKVNRPDEAVEASPPAERPAAHVNKPGRNEPCPCGSGKKYKKCCGR
jgi:hypothetical protein